MKSYKRTLLLLVLIIILSLTSTTVSFFREFSYGWGSDLVGIPKEEVWEVAITQHGFPFGWYAMIKHIHGGHLETETFEFRSGAFIIDIIFYIILYSAIAAFIFWRYPNRDLA